MAVYASSWPSVLVYKAPTAIKTGVTGVLGWKFVEEVKMSKSSSGKAQTTVIAVVAIARICNAAWWRFSASS
jgi:hypothetical protein